LLIVNGTEVNARNERDQTPLCQAVFHGRKDVVELLIARGADINVKDKDRQTPLSSALETRHEDIALLLIKADANIHAKGEYGETFLHNAALFGRCEVARLLLDRGIDVNTRDNFGRTPLHYAVAKEALEDSHLNMVMLLVARGAAVNVKDEVECTALNIATDMLAESKEKNARYRIVKFLIDNGADVKTHGDLFGVTPLDWVISAGHIDIVELQIARDAEVNTEDIDGTTALHMASRENHVEIAKLLLASGADVNARDQGRRMPLHQAAFFGHKDLVTLLVAHGADIAARDMSGHTPLYEAAWGGYRDIVEFLITKGADFHSLGKDGETVLHLAAEYGYTGTVALLISKGLDVHAKNRYGATPLELAVGGYRNQKKLPEAKDSDSYCARGDYFYRQDEFERAIEDYSSAVRLNPQNDRAYYCRGRAWAEKDNPQQAVADWKKAIELDWQNALHVHYARRLLKSPDPELDRLIKDTAIEHLGDLKEVTGYAVGGGGSPGDFYVFSLVLSKPFDENRFLKMAHDENPVIRAMAMICLAREDLPKHKDVTRSFYTDCSEVPYVPVGCIMPRISLDKLAKSIIDDPNVLDYWSAAHTDWKFSPSERNTEREAMVKGQIGVIQTLIVHGANVNQQGRYRATPLHYAAENGGIRVAEFLITNGADVNAKNNKGETPLHCATFWGYRQMIELLIAHGADINARTNEGQTAMDIATQKDYPGLSTLLREFQQKL
jgi:cytohesin